MCFGWHSVQRFQVVSIAYFIMLHNKPHQLEELFEALYNEVDIFILHVDLKSRLGLRPSGSGVFEMAARLAEGKPNVTLMRSRFTNWGGWSLSSVLLSAMDCALHSEYPWTHFVNLSGQCFPTISPVRFRNLLADYSQDGQFVEMRPFATLPRDDWHLAWSPMLETPLKTLRMPGKRMPPTDLAVSFKGSQWVFLSRKFCSWQAQSPVQSRTVAYLRQTFLSDELLVQTLLSNAPENFFSVLDFPTRYLVWPGPRLLSYSDLPEINRSGAPFVRKVDSGHDERLISGLKASVLV